MTPEDGNSLILEKLSNPEPLMVARFGSIELECVSSYVIHGNWGTFNVNQMHRNAGFFPLNREFLVHFCDQFMGDLSSVDIMGTWDKPNEGFMLNQNCPLAARVPLRSLEPYYHENPWSLWMRGKKILVVHPCEDTIRSQYAKRESLFNNPEILPECTLETVKAVQSIAGAQVPFASWFEAFEHMCKQIQGKDFDLAIIGAGAYGLPLAAFVKSLGKKAIHMGGATQILFGIKGARWDTHDVISTFYNEHWVRPSAEETPPSFKSVENGCYW